MWKKQSRWPEPWFKMAGSHAPSLRTPYIKASFKLYVPSKRVLYSTPCRAYSWSFWLFYVVRHYMAILSHLRVFIRLASDLALKMGVDNLRNTLLQVLGGTYKHSVYGSTQALHATSTSPPHWLAFDSISHSDRPLGLITTKAANIIFQ